MADHPSITSFQQAKSRFEEKARNFTATGGIIDNGGVMEEELAEVLMLARDAPFPLTDEDLRFLGPTAQLFAQVSGGQVPETLWQDNLRLLTPLAESGMILAQPEETEVSMAAQDTVRIQPTTEDDIPMDGIEAQVPAQTTLVSELHSPQATGGSPVAPPNELVTPASVTPEAETALPPRSHDAPPSPVPATLLDEVPAATVDNTSVQPRSSTGGKSIEYLSKLGMLRKPRVKLTLKKRGREQHLDDEDSVGGSDGEDEMEEDDDDSKTDDGEYAVPIAEDKRPKKRRRMVSAPSIEDSDADIPSPPPRKTRTSKPRADDNWPTTPSREPCPMCLSVGETCMTFGARPTGWPGKQRIACKYCYLKKRGCIFNLWQRQGRRIGEAEGRTDQEREKRKRREAKKKAEAERKKAGEDKADGEEVENERETQKPGKGKMTEGRHNDGEKPKKNKGKAKQVDDDEEDGGSSTRAAPRQRRRFRSVLPHEAGPSNQRRVEPDERPGDYAELCARMNDVRDEVRRFQDAAMERFSSMDQQVDRIDSNLSTQRDYFTQELKGIRGTADAAFEQSGENRSSINAILQYSGQSAEFMTGLMDRLASLRFDLPNAFDQWATLRFGEHGAPSTVSASQLHHMDIKPEASRLSFPTMQLPPMNISGQEGQQPSAIRPPSPQQPLPTPLSQSDQPSPRKLWKEYMLTQSSSSGEDVDMAKGSQVQHEDGIPHVKVEPNATIPEAWTTRNAEVEPHETPTLEEALHQALRAPVTVDLNDRTSMDVDAIGNVTEEQQDSRLPIPSDIDPDGHGSTDAVMTESLSVIEEESRGESTTPHPNTSVPTPSVTPVTVLPPTPLASQPSDRSSPSLVGDMTVHPPQGLLATHLPSDRQQSEQQADSGMPLIVRSGPVTRSRSGSRSTGSIGSSAKPKSRARKPSSRKA